MGVYWIHVVPLSVRLSFCLCVRVYLDDISRTNQPFLTKLGMVLYYHEAKYYAEKLDHCQCHQCQGRSEGLHNQNMTISTLSYKLLVCLQPALV